MDDVDVVVGEDAYGGKTRFVDQHDINSTTATTQFLIFIYIQFNLYKNLIRSID